MNRLHHLKETLPKNMWDNRDYFNLEFVLLDYNSSDGLEDYVRSEFATSIKDGRLVYYRTEDPELYNMSHSRNLAFKMASGDIVCNIDADNFTGKDFAFYVNEAFGRNKNIFLSTHGFSRVKNDVLGRLCLTKKHFIKVGGYDERMKHYGFDDYDLVNRLKMYGLKMQTIDSKEFLNAIRHSNTERMDNGVNDKGLKYLLIRYLTPARSQLFFLFQDEMAYIGTMRNNHTISAINDEIYDKRKYKYNFSIENNGWDSGRWIASAKGRIQIESLHCKLDLYKRKGDVIYFNGDTYYEVTNGEFRERALFFFHQVSNRNIMEQNLSQRHYLVNEDGYGNAKVVQNFNVDTPFYV